MIKKMWRYLRQIDKYELLQQVISVHEVELLRKMMTDSLLGCSVGYVFSKILKISFLRFIQSEGDGILLLTFCGCWEYLLSWSRCLSGCAPLYAMSFGCIK